MARVPEQPGKSAYNKERQELQTRLAEVMRRLALTPEEIHSLPNNYERAVASGQFAKEYDPRHPDLPFLPPDLFDLLGGPWVALYAQGPSSEPVAARHVSTFSRSSFVIFVRLPGGRKSDFRLFPDTLGFPTAVDSASARANNRESRSATVSCRNAGGIGPPDDAV